MLKEDVYTCTLRRMRDMIQFGALVGFLFVLPVFKRLKD